MKLSGKDLAGYVKQRHFNKIKGMDPKPKLVIVMSTSANAATRSYVHSSKSRYAGDIGAVAEVHEVGPNMPELKKLMAKLNADKSVNGIIVQLPFEDIDTDELLALIDPDKDIDGLSPKPVFDPATAKAIVWIMSSYGIDWNGKKVVVVGQGRLVGKPLAQMLESSGAKVIRCNSKTADLKAETMKGDIVVSAVGKPKLITDEMIKPGTVLIDAGTADLGGSVVGDVDHALYERDDIKVTPNPGGVGPMTVASLFDNLILAYDRQHND